ncbi:alpha-sarcoglycan [Lampris incognitus]|uniref:alpha-sarcoglycan n=1 Tax=Lampris incognitus TaxID=2546036 RepID=UPI0024B48E20|nr:alpha-sarcoglycan [Lampris incognitus]XP_056153452.1 alpha-sarcoglycan [Lampris incognitus]
MAGKWSRVFLLAVCAVSLLGAEVKVSIPVGKLFTHELMRETFQIYIEPLSKLYGNFYDDPIVFKCNLQNFPDLPEWLRFTQRHPYDNGFLYGTPAAPGNNIIEIFAINKRSYVTAKQILTIAIVLDKNPLPYQAEFFIQLREIEKVLPSAVQEEIKQDLQRLWGSEALEVVNVTNALDRGGRVPLPIAGHFEGVYFKVGSKQYFSECLQKVLTPEHQRQCTSRTRVKAPGGCNFCNIPSNCITWCKTELFNVSKPKPTPALIMGSGILESGGDFNPPEFSPERDFFLDYIITVIVPLILAIILCLLLSYIMYCRREGVEKRNKKTTEIQMYHHHTIHGTSDELRMMAGSRDVPPPPLSTLPMFNFRTGERVSPLEGTSPTIPLIMAHHEPYSDTLPRK